MKRLLMFAAIAAPLHVIADTFYVDQNISDCSTYAPESRSCGTGTSESFSDLNTGLGAVAAGDTLLLREGTYSQLKIQKSGSSTQPIIIKGFTGEEAVISSYNVALMVIEQSNVTIKDIIVKDIVGFGRIESSTNIVFDSIKFNNASNGGTTSSLKFVSSSYNQVLNSSFSEGADLLIFQDNANFNLLQGNDFGTSAHSSISIRCSSQNVIRANTFNNPDQKAMEIYDCEGVSDAPVRLDDTKTNLLEDNQFLGTRASTKNYKYNAIQHGGQQTIVRHNVFANNLGGGVNYQIYSQESLYVYKNRLYNNTFYNNNCYGIIGNSGKADQYYDNRVVNNLLYKNTDCNGENEQIAISDSDVTILINNSLADENPGFTNAALLDLTLTEKSNQIDTGTYVAQATIAGSGTSLVVDDASWFYDGFGIPGETGDQIRIEGQDSVVTVESIDYSTNTLTLSRSLTWNTGDGVHLKYSGNSPDVGAFEFESAPSVLPSAPTGVNITLNK